MKVTTIVNSSQVNASSTVLINLSGAGGPNGRITVNESLTLAELGVDPSAVESKKPTFPEAEISAINASGLDEGTKAQKIQGVIVAYQEAAAAFVTSGGETVEDRIIHATLDYLVAKHNFSRTDSPTKAVISDDELQVTAVPVGNTVLFSVNGTAVWG